LRFSKEHWVDFIPHREDVSIEEFELYKDFIVLHERKMGLPQINIANFHDGRPRIV
jgi:oligopeptidase B